MRFPNHRRGQPSKPNIPAIAASAIRVFSFIIPRPRASAAENKKGALTYAPRQALVCPRRNAFGTPSLGVLQAVSFFQNYQFCLGHQPKPQIGGCVFSGLLLLTDGAIQPLTARRCKCKFCTCSSVACPASGAVQ